MELYDLRETKFNREQKFIKILAWPVNVWTCYIPENINPSFNILEKLVLSLIDKGLAKSSNDLKEILYKKIGFNRELIENVVDECCSKYIDHRSNNLKLNTEVKKNLHVLDEGISSDTEMSDKMRKVWLFQDLVSNEVIPCFSINKRPNEYKCNKVDDKECITFKVNRDWKQPSTASISTALYYWSKIQRNIKNFDSVSNSKIDMSKLKEDDTADDQRLLSDVPNETKDIRCITIYDDEPTFLMLKGYISFNCNYPEDIDIISPLGEVYDAWFMKSANKFRIRNSEFDEELKLFLMVKRDELKDSIAFNNELNVRLFEEFPVICNNRDYSILKLAINNLTKHYERIKNKEDDSRDFLQSLRTALEVVFKIGTTFSGISNIKKNFNGGFEMYNYEISQLVDTNEGLSSEIKRLFNDKNIYNNFISKNRYTKDEAASILIYANRNRNSSAMKFVRLYQHFFIDIFKLCNMGNCTIHLEIGMKEICLSEDEAKKYYEKYKDIVRAVFNVLIGGVENGEEK